MENPIKTNRLAIVSFVSGLMALLLTFGVFFVRLSFYTSLEGTLPEPTDPALARFEFWSTWVGRLGSLATFGAIITGILALREIRRKGGMDKGKLFAWIGIILGGGWILFRVLVAIYFILGMLFSLR